MNKIFQILQGVARPVRAEFLFFVMVFLLLVQQPAEWLCLPSSNREWLTGKFLLAMGIEVGVAYFLTWLAWVSRCRVVKWLLLLLCWLLMGITLFLVTNFEMAISQQTLTVLVETTPNESAEFVATYMWSGESILSYLIDLAVAIAIVLLLVLEKRIKRALAPALLRPWVEGMVAMVVLAGVGMGVWAYGWLGYCSNSSRVYRWRHQFPPASLDIFTQSMQALNSLRAFDNDVKMALEQARKVQETHPTIEEPDSLTLVYVLGESYIKHHAGIYGYPLNTTPRLNAERERGNLFVFNDVVAQENITSVVEKNTFSINSVADGESWFETPNFTTIFKRSGYDVYMWDIQRDFMAHKLFTMTVNQYVYNPEISRLSYTATNRRRLSYDGDLIDDFAHSVKFKNKHNLVVFHLFGQHVAPSNRYRKGSYYDGYFTADSIKRTEKWLTSKKKTDIANYDNATLYNDAVIGKIIDLYRQRNAVIVYFSDHGEEMYDFRDAKGRHSELVPRAGTLKFQYEVPFVVWCSDAYMQRYPQAVQRLKAALNRPFMTDNVGQLLFSLGKVKTVYYKPERDPMSPQFKPRKRILYDRVDYDEVMKKAKRDKIGPHFAR